MVSNASSKMRILRVLAPGLAALAALAVAVWALRPGAGEPLPPPPGIRPPTATPDTRSAVSPDEAAALLSRNPNLGAVVSAVQRGDVDGLLALVDWQPQRCGLPKGSTDLCPEGVEPYTELPMIDAGAPGEFWVTAETLRPTLELLLSGEPLKVRLALRSRQNPDQFFVAFAGPTKGDGLLPLAAPSFLMTGMMLELDAASDRPIKKFYWVGEQWKPGDEAYELGLEDKDIIAWDEGY